MTTAAIVALVVAAAADVAAVGFMRAGRRLACPLACPASQPGRGQAGCRLPPSTQYSASVHSPLDCDKDQRCVRPAIRRISRGH